MKQFSSSRVLPKSLTPEEWVSLVKVIPKKDKIGKICFLLAYGSGLRVSEVLNLKKDDVRENYIQIWQSKGGVDRTVPIPKGWKMWMKDFIPINRTPRTLQRKMKSYCKRAGISPLYTFHSLRHSFGTRCVEQGLPINQVQILMGHSSIAVTSIYTKARPTDALKSYEDLF